MHIPFGKSYREETACRKIGEGKHADPVGLLKIVRQGREPTKGQARGCMLRGSAGTVQGSGALRSPTRDQPSLLCCEAGVERKLGGHRNSSAGSRLGAGSMYCIKDLGKA